MLLYFSPGYSLLVLLLAIPAALYIGIRNAYRRRKFRQLMDERNRLFDQGDNEGYRRAQQELTEWARKLHPRALKELERWYAAHPSEYMREWKRAQEEKRRRRDEEWKRLHPQPKNRH